MITSMIQRLVPTLYELNRELRDKPGNVFQITKLCIGCFGDDLVVVLRLKFGRGICRKHWLEVCHAINHFREASTHEFDVEFTWLKEEELLEVALTLVDCPDLNDWDPSSEGATIH